MLLDSLYHPPIIGINYEKTTPDNLYLVHKFEGKELYKPYIGDTMLGIEFLWGGQVQLESTDIVPKKMQKQTDKKEYEYRKVLYTCKAQKMSKVLI